MKRKELAEKSADRVSPKCRESYIKGYMAGAAAQVRHGNSVIEKIRSGPKMQCPNCLAQHMVLERMTGWSCTICKAGPYMVHTDGLRLKTQ